MGPTLRWRLLSRLKKGGVQLETGIKVIEIRDDGVEALRNEKSEFFRSDDVILAVGMKSNDGLVQELKAKLPQFHQVGDSLQPRKMGEAIQEAYHAAATL